MILLMTAQDLLTFLSQPKMKGHMSRLLTIASLLFLVIFVSISTPSVFEPDFQVINDTTGTIYVVAMWRSNEKVIGEI